ncbi:N terminal domain [Trypanosoma vivax]|nr:N terminal domain [Trypanosoma vivax]
MGSVCIVAGNGNRPLAEAVALLMGIPTHNTTVTQRANGEVNVRICESVLGADVYIIQSTSGNGLIDVNTALMELLLLIRKMRLSNAKRVTAIITYFAYSRQDRKHSVRGPISAAAVAQMLTTAGVDRVTTVDLHSGQIQVFLATCRLTTCYCIASSRSTSLESRGSTVTTCQLWPCRLVV